MLFDLAEGDLTKYDLIKKKSVETVYITWYMKRVKTLNGNISSLPKD